MERRPDPAFDFNEPLLLRVLTESPARIERGGEDPQSARRPSARDWLNLPSLSAIVQSDCGGLVRPHGYPVIVSMAFLSPGRHAGEGGDVAAIIQEALAFRCSRARENIDTSDASAKEGLLPAADLSLPADSATNSLPLDIRMTSLVSDGIDPLLIDVLVDRYLQASAAPA